MHHRGIQPLRQSHQTELIHPIVLLLPHQIAHEDPSQHAPLHVVVHIELLHGILPTEQVKVIHAINRGTNRPHRNQGGR